MPARPKEGQAYTEGMEHTLKMKRVYLPEENSDGIRILVDRLWPRGESKIKADLSEWNKQIAPSKDLRMAFHHDQIPFDQFKARYLKELAANPEAKAFVQHIQDLLQKQDVTLLYSARNERENNAVVLYDWLHEQLKNKA